MTYIVTLFIVSRATRVSKRRYLLDMLPYILLSGVMTAAAVGVMWWIGETHPLVALIVMIGTGIFVYLAGAKLLRLPELPECASYIFGRFRR